MALTQAQWYAKLKSFLPAWFWQEENYQTAHAQALALILSEVQSDVDAYIEETFILDASGENLVEHGEERSKRRLPGETESAFRQRIRIISNQANPPSLLDLVRSIIIAGYAEIREHQIDLPFCNRESFYSRKYVFADLIYNTFSVIIDRQIHAPYSFASREYFCSRENFYGTSEPLQSVYDAIAQAVDENKALGTLFRLIETSA